MSHFILHNKDTFRGSSRALRDVFPALTPWDTRLGLLSRLSSGTGRRSGGPWGPEGVVGR